MYFRYDTQQFGSCNNQYVAGNGCAETPRCFSYRVISILEKNFYALALCLSSSAGRSVSALPAFIVKSSKENDTCHHLYMYNGTIDQWAVYLPFALTFKRFPFGNRLFVGFIQF